MKKIDEELGFKHLNLFNQALLAKNAWKMSVQPNSLHARVLKAKYFPIGSFLQVKKESNAFYIWSNLLWGRCLLLKGLGRTIILLLTFLFWNEN